MPWVRIDDQYPEHPKIVAAGHLAAWLDVCALAYSNRALTDGFIAKAMVARLSSVPAPLKRAAELVEVGRWSEVEGGYQINDYLEYQKSGAQIRKEREQTANRQARFRNRTAVDNRADNAARNGVTNGPVTLSPLPHPSNTVGLLLTSVPDAGRDEVAARSVEERDDDLNRAGLAAARAARKQAAS